MNRSRDGGGKAKESEGRDNGSGRLDGAQRRELEARRDALTAEIEAAEARVAEIDQLFCRPGYYDATPPGEVTELEAERAALLRRVEHLMGRWESVERELEGQA